MKNTKTSCLILLFVHRLLFCVLSSVFFINLFMFVGFSAYLLHFVFIVDSNNALSVFLFLSNLFQCSFCFSFSSFFILLRCFHSVFNLSECTVNTMLCDFVWILKSEKASAFYILRILFVCAS